jgi:hypothetical protein
LSTVLLADFAVVWNELFPVEQARVVQLLVERVDVRVLGGRAGHPFILENLERPLPASWEAQRDQLGC